MIQSFKKNRLAALMALGLALHGGPAAALGLMEAYQLALQNDPAYRAAFYASEAGKENRILGRSNLLPQVSASYNASQNRTTVTQTNTSIGDYTYPRDYIARTSAVQLRQPVLNLDGLARYRQGKAQGDYAEAQFGSQQQEVIIRMVSAYLDVLFKEDLLRLSEAQRDTLEEQRKVNDRLFKGGEGTSTDMLETQARLDSAEAAVLEGRDLLTDARQMLSAVIGREPGELDQLIPDFRVRPADTVSFEAWKNIALERNPDIKTQEANLEMARQEINKARAGHAPRVDLVAVYSKSSSDTLTTYDQDTIARSIGIQINIPLYSGGAVNAQSRQAVANQEKARADLQTQKDKVVQELRKDYDALLSSNARINALLKSVSSSELLITATEKSVQGGVRINLDVLNAKQQLYVTRRDLAQARYNYVLNTLRMRAAVGTLSGDDVREIAPYFR